VVSYLRFAFLANELTLCRDSEDSAPAEYPPEQPEADELEDDENRYGAEEAEMQAALEKELEETEARVQIEVTNGGDAEMSGVEPPKKEDEEGSEAGSEDLEAESSDDDDEEDEEGEGEEELAEGEEKTGETQTNGEKADKGKQPEVMVH
jgi:histone chaperone ASF1